MISRNIFTVREYYVLWVKNWIEEKSPYFTWDSILLSNVLEMQFSKIDLLPEPKWRWHYKSNFKQIKIEKLVWNMYSMVDFGIYLFPNYSYDFREKPATRLRNHGFWSFLANYWYLFKWTLVFDTLLFTSYKLHDYVFSDFLLLWCSMMLILPETTMSLFSRKS